LLARLMPLIFKESSVRPWGLLGTGKVINEPDSENYFIVLLLNISFIFLFVLMLVDVY